MNTLNIGNNQAIKTPELKDFDLEAFIDSAPEISDSKTGSVFDNDIKNAQKVEVPEAREFFNSSDKANNQQKNIEPEFTIDQPEAPKKEKDFLDINWNQSIGKPKEEPLGESSTETVVAEEKTISKLEEMQLKAELKHAVDQYNEIIAKAVRLQKDIESKGGNDGEIPKVNIANVLEDPRLHDPRVSSAVKSRLLQELTQKLENEDSKSETDEYEKIIKDIEPAKTKVSDALEAVMAKTLSSVDVEKVRLSMVNLVVEDEVTASHKQDWEAICINRKAEIDELPNVSPGIIESIDEIGKKKAEEAIISDKSANTESVVQQPVIGGEDKADNQQDSILEKVQDKDVKTEKTEDPGVIAPASGIENSQVSKFEEFASIDETGKIVTEDSTEHAEIDLSKSKGNVELTATSLAGLKKGDGNTENTGVVNLSKEDLGHTIEINPTHPIRDRVEALKKAEQSLPEDGDLFGPSKEPITDIDHKPLGSDNKIIEEAKDKKLPGTEKKEQDVVVATEKGPDLVALSPDETEKVVKPKEINSEAKPVEHKRVGLFEKFGRILGLGKDNTFTTDKISKIEEDVMRTRSSTVEESAEQAK